MPFMPVGEMHMNPCIGVTSYENPENAADVVELLVCTQAATLETDAIKKSYPDVDMDSLVKVMRNYSQDVLKQKVNSNSGTLKVHLDGKEIVLKHKTHFYLNARDKAK